MKRRRKTYRFIIEDETRLSDVWSMRFTSGSIILLATSTFIILLLFAGCLLTLTPMRSLLPGYLKSGEREQMIRNLMRIDSLEEGYRQREGYVKNIMAILDSGRAVSFHNNRLPVNIREPEADLLSEPSEEEKAFVKMMDERERYNLSVLNPAAADGLLFVDIAPGSVITEGTANSPRTEIILPSGSDVYADADGTVTGCRYSSETRGYDIEIHHARGYITHYYGVGTPLVRKGERVSAGQAIASPPDKRGIGSHRIILEIWRDGEAMLPASIIKSK